MMKGISKRGEARVKIGAKCTGGKHGSCSVQECECDCHARSFTSWDHADIERVKTGRKMTYLNGVFTVGALLLVVGLTGCGLDDREARRGKVLSVKVYESPSYTHGPEYHYTMSQSADDRITTNFYSRKKHEVGDVFCFAYDRHGDNAHEKQCPFGLKPWPEAPPPCLVQLASGVWIAQDLESGCSR